MHRCDDVFCYSESRARGEIVPRRRPTAKLKSESSPTATNHGQQQPSSITIDHHRPRKTPRPRALYHSNNQHHPPKPAGPHPHFARLGSLLDSRPASLLRPSTWSAGSAKTLDNLRATLYTLSSTTHARKGLLLPTDPSGIPPLPTAAPRVALLTSSPRLGDPARVAGILGPQALRSPQLRSHNWNCTHAGSEA